MRTLLTLKRFSRDGRLLDLRQQYSRSFTIHFIEALYLSHAQILTGAPLVVADILGSATRTADCDAYQPSAPNFYPKSNMQIAGPSGKGSIALFSGSNNTVYYPYGHATMRPGFVVGIQIGRDNTLETPTDARLIDPIAHGTGPSVAPAAAIDSLLAGDTAELSYHTNAGLMGMIYKPLRNVLMSSWQVKAFRDGNPGNVTANVVAVAGLNTGYPGADTTVLATSNIVNANLWGAASPGAMVTFTFAAPVLLQAGFTYYIYISPSQVSPGNCINLRVFLAHPGRHSTANATGLGVSLALAAAAEIFEIDGTCGAEMEYGATDIYGYTVVDPDASFTMRRIFMNNSGEAITVQESGIYLPVTRYKAALSTSNTDENNVILCAARDTFAGIAVANGESLEVDYTPSIANH